MNLLTKIRKLIVGKDFSRGRISSMVRKKAFTQLIKYCKPKNRILDVGCGEGLFLRRAAKELNSAQFTGIDSWEKILEHARQQLIIEGISNVKLEAGQAGSLPYGDETFEHVLFLNGIFNQKEDKSVSGIVQEMLRVCATGGLVYFDIRNRKNVLFSFLYWIALKLDSTKPLVKLYDKKFIEDILNTMNYQKVEYIPIGRIMRTGYLVEITK
ncbi:MAG: class I SAM-dependent methyltransferase [Elusimicrobiota bacterium]